MKDTNQNLRDVAIEFGLTNDEYNKIIELIGREPNYTELGMYSVMWSEHCSYKNSIAELKKLPRKGKRLLVEAGEENAGLVDIGDGLAIAFKIESHNHPSAVEPYQGAATGVGGIMRDIFTMGARPIAALDSLRFGNPEIARTQYLMKGIVKGIGDYGNSFGVPTIAGDIFFDECYNENPLVNAMAVGIVKHDEIAKAVAKGEGNIVMIVGSATGRDGIHGATFASEELSDESEHKRPNVQVGDPFTEKLLLEATLEVIKHGYVVGIQDMGAAGITCSVSEMSARGNSGMVINLDEVPLREKNMTAYEILLSESQERMLLVAKPEHQTQIETIFSKWDLHCKVIGKVVAQDRIKMWKDGSLVVDIPAQGLVLGGGAPVYIRESREPEYIKQTRMFNQNTISEPDDYNECLLKLLSSPNIRSKRWATEQYDSMVRTNTIQIEGITDAAVIRIKGTNKAIAVKTDCNPRYVYLNPYEGAKIAVAEAARNVVCVGAKPIAITNCLNFGNPYDPEVYWQFRESIRGIKEACEALETPVTGGNVSFYNEHNGSPIFPTPVIGMLGEISDVRNIIPNSFVEDGDVIVLVGTTIGHIGGSEYLAHIHNQITGDSPTINLHEELQLQSCLLELIHKKLIRSCHDVSDGGLGITLAEMCMNHQDLGAVINYNSEIRNDLYLFTEDQSRVVISCKKGMLEEIKTIFETHRINYSEIGQVKKGGTLSINNIIEVSNNQLLQSYGLH
ncbi:MAG: phosphoribosylformylglycinamidine synthase subunit PurL [Ignavibacteriae bacterium]|nr:phosphoribosylformylglycinamidine synthase subunit PurL [Ignavibacteriota bacterium]